MVPNAKKTKQLVIATRQKLHNVNQLPLDLYVNGVSEGFSTFERFEHSTGTSEVFLYKILLLKRFVNQSEK